MTERQNIDRRRYCQAAPMDVTMRYSLDGYGLLA